MEKTAQVDDIYMDAVNRPFRQRPGIHLHRAGGARRRRVRGSGCRARRRRFFAANAALGAASMVLSTGAHPAVLKDELTTLG